jgi:hypothetical protein
MANISKYVQLNEFLLLEYEFNRDGVQTTLTSPMVVGDASFNTKYFFEASTALITTHNVLPLNSVQADATRSSWFFDPVSYGASYPLFWESSTALSTTTYPMDVVKVHIVSGYNFSDVGGFLLQLQAETSTGSLIDLANFTYAKQAQIVDGNVIKFAENTLFLGNKFYDKYLELFIPSVQALGNQSLGKDIESVLAIKQLSDVHISYSTIYDLIDNYYTINELISLQLPVTSNADSFNAYIAESTAGDYIEFYATWNNLIIGNYMGDIESGRIPLYTSNNPNDNFQEFIDTYGAGANKWSIIHEISIYEQIPGASILTQKYAFTQDNNFSNPNLLRPILLNADIAASYSIQYVCRLTNRMDGTQIIRKASFSSTDPKKYGLTFTRINVENLVPYKVFNRIESEKPNIMTGSGLEKVKYIKIFYDTVSVVMNAFNEVFPNGAGPLFLKDADSVYKFKFERIDVNGDRVNVDLSGAFNYSLAFKLDDNSKIEVGPTYSTNMNTTIGEIEFKLKEDQLTTLKTQSNNVYTIVVKNPNGSEYVFYQGTFYNMADQESVIANYSSMFAATDLQAKIAELQTQVNTLNAALAAVSEE